jgi:putative nucleotidyltransferase with HDIG domain
MQKTDYIPVSTKFITSFVDPLPFNVYIQRADGIFSNIYKKNSSYDYDQIKRYESNKVKFLYVNKEDKIEYETFIIGLTENKILEKEQFIEAFKVGLELNYEHFQCDNEEVKINLDLATVNVKNSIKLLENDLQTAIEIFKALASNSQLLKHSYMVSLFSVILAKELGFTLNKALLNIGLGALLHDVGLTRFSNEMLSKVHLSAKEWDEIKDHAQFGLRIVDHSKAINSEVRTIIIQHHEQHNGRGYPNRLLGNQIYPPAKIVAIADGFCSLVSNTSYRKTSWNYVEALGILKDDIGHYDPEYLEVFSTMILKKKTIL